MLKLLNFLPPLDLIESILIESPMELSITKDFYGIIENFHQNIVPAPNVLNDTFVMVAAVKDHLWEVINTGHFSTVNKFHRQLYGLMSLEKAILFIIKNEIGIITEDEAYEKCMWELDNGLLLGCPLDQQKYCNVLSDCLMQLQNKRKPDEDKFEITNIILNDTRPVNQRCDIDILVQPAIHEFKQNYFDQSKPLILAECMKQWPALSKWIQPAYLLNICRNRTVPIEIGKNYTNENWSQDLIKFEDFFRRQFTNQNDLNNASKKIEYLAQHNLFDQIPALRNDIITPEYCCISNNDDEIDIDIKAWLGPEGTISPMHIDEKHNLLCQVFGSKRIILAAPKDSDNLYPFEGDMLKNTSQIDAENVDVDRFPLSKNVEFFTMTLHKGEMLYIPPKWWHFVRSLSKSFSVSFWWE